MYKSSIMILILAVVLTACGASRQGGRKPMFQMRVSEMFPDDIMAQSLAVAASKGDIERIDKLVARGANVNAVGEYGVTLPYWVLLHPNKEGFRRLLEHGANPNVIWVDPKTKFEDSLLHQAVLNSSTIGVDYLKMALEIGNGNPNLSCGSFNDRPLRWATSEENSEAFVALYNAGAEIDFWNDYGRAFVSDVAYGANYKLTFFLLQQGVDYMHKDKNGLNLHSRIEWNLKVGKIQYFSKNNNPQYMWFWRCVDFLEKRGMAFDIPLDIKRPAVLDTNEPDFVSNLKKR